MLKVVYDITVESIRSKYCTSATVSSHNTLSKFSFRVV